MYLYMYIYARACVCEALQVSCGKNCSSNSNLQNHMDIRQGGACLVTAAVQRRGCYIRILDGESMYSISSVCVCVCRLY